MYPKTYVGWEILDILASKLVEIMWIDVLIFPGLRKIEYIGPKFACVRVYLEKICPQPAYIAVVNSKFARHTWLFKLIVEVCAVKARLSAAGSERYPGDRYASIFRAVTICGTQKPI